MDSQQTLYEIHYSARFIGTAQHPITTATAGDRPVQYFDKDLCVGVSIPGYNLKSSTD